MKEMLTRAWSHVEWADRRVAAALSRCADDERAGRALGLFAHVVAAEAVWLERIEGGPPTHDPWPTAELARDQARAAAHAEAVRALIEQGDLDRRVEYRTTSGVAHSTRLSDILLHVALHGAYHRGQIAWLLRAADLEPVPTDYIVQVREEGL